MSCIQSCFNFIYKRQQNENVIYNTFSKALVVLEEVYDQYVTLSFIDSEIESQLVDNGLVANSFDEMGFLKYVHYKTKFSKDPYCQGSFSKKFMPSSRTYSYCHRRLIPHFCFICESMVKYIMS
jgi:hypothetical protein